MSGDRLPRFFATCADTGAGPSVFHDEHADGNWVLFDDADRWRTRALKAEEDLATAEDRIRVVEAERDEARAERDAFIEDYSLHKDRLNAMADERDAARAEAASMAGGVRELEQLEQEVERLRSLINTPQVADFVPDVLVSAMHDTVHETEGPSRPARSKKTTEPPVREPTRALPPNWCRVDMPLSVAVELELFTKLRAMGFMPTDCVCQPGFVPGHVIHADSCPVGPHASDVVHPKTSSGAGGEG